MKIFQTIQMHLAWYGYEANLLPFNKRHKMVLADVVFSLTVYNVHLFYEANLPQGYLDTIYMIVVTTVITISRISTMLKMKNIFLFIDEIEAILDASEYSQIIDIVIFRSFSKNKTA